MQTGKLPNPAMAGFFKIENYLPKSVISG